MIRRLLIVIFGFSYVGCLIAALGGLFQCALLHQPPPLWLWVTINVSFAPFYFFIGYWVRTGKAPLMTNMFPLETANSSSQSEGGG